MARVAAPRAAGPVEGVYEAVRLNVVEGLRSAPDHRGRLRCLEAMTAGAPVRVVGSLLPESVRVSAAYVAAARAVGRFGDRFVRPVVATVYPDGRISFAAQTAADWMSEYMPDELIDYRGSLMSPAAEENRL